MGINASRRPISEALIGYISHAYSTLGAGPVEQDAKMRSRLDLTRARRVRLMVNVDAAGSAGSWSRGPVLDRRRDQLGLLRRGGRALSLPSRHRALGLGLGRRARGGARRRPSAPGGRRGEQRGQPDRAPAALAGRGVLAPPTSASPGEAPPTFAPMRMLVPLSTLGTLLDLPDGVSVAGVDGTEGAVVLHLDGVDASIDGDDVSAEYFVDAKGHRSFGRFVAPEPVEETPAPPEPEPPVTGTVGQAPATKAAGSRKRRS